MDIDTIISHTEVDLRLINLAIARGTMLKNELNDYRQIIDVQRRFIFRTLRRFRGEVQSTKVEVKMVKNDIRNYISRH